MREPHMFAHSLMPFSLPWLAFTSALTDPLISGIAKGSEQYKLVGSYVTAPLNWYVQSRC